MTVRFVKDHSPGDGQRQDWCDFPAGTTIEKACGTTEVRAWVNGREVSTLFMQRAHLKDGVEVFVEPIPKDPVSLSIAASIAAGAAAATSSTLAIALAVTSVALSVGASLMAQKAAKDAMASDRGSFDRLNAITGTSNEIASYAPIPRLFGRMRYYPPVPMTAPPYTEIAGDDQYIRMYFALNNGGPVEIGGHIVGPGYPKITHETPLADTNGQRPVVIGETDIAEYEDIEWEIGTPEQMTLYTDQILEENPQWTTESDAGGYDDDDNPTVYDNLSTVRTTEAGATGFSVDLTGQIYTTDSKGRFKKIRIRWEAAWRLNGTNDAWQTEEFVQSSRGTKTSRVNFAKTGLAEGKYDVRITRVRTYFSNLEGPPQSKVTWTALRTMRDRRAFTVPNTVVMTLRGRSTDQLNGTIDKLAVLATSVLDVYDTETQTWTKKPTRAHAWAFHSVLTDSANRQPIEHDDLNLSSLLAWEAETEAAGRYYDNVLDDNGTTLSRMQDIVQAGRATWTIDSDTTIRPVLDTVQAVPKMLVSPRNSFGYSYQLSAYDPPHAVKVRYVDPITWETTERIVYDDGYGEFDDPANDIEGATLFETIEATGCTDGDQAWKDGRRYLANKRLRAIEKHGFSQVMEHYKYYGVGDLLELSNDVILVGLAYGRIQRVSTNAQGRAVAITCDEYLPMPDADKEYGVKIQRGSDRSFTVMAVRNNAPGARTVQLVEPVDNLRPDDHVTFGETDKITIDVKCVTITPQGETAQVLCEPAAPEVLDAETGAIPAPPNDITVRPKPGNTPPNVPSIDAIISDASVAIENDDGSLSYRLAVNVSPNSGRTPTARIVVQAKIADDELKYTERDAQDRVAYFDGFEPGDVVTIRAKAVSDDVRESQWVYYYNYTIVGRQPEKPTGVTVTAGTFQIQLDPQGGPPAAVYEFWRSMVALATDQIEQQATPLPQGRSLTDADLQPLTTYYYYLRRMNTYGLSDWLAVQATTRNEPGAVITNESGRIDELNLADELRDRIDLIDGPPELAGSVAQRVQAEADAREAAIDAEAQQRAAAISQAYTDLQQYADSESAAALQTQQLITTFGGNTANALSFTVSEVDASLAISTTFDSIDSQFQAVTADVATKASITRVDQVESGAESARASLSQNLQADYDGKLASKAGVSYVDDAIAGEESARAAAIQQARSEIGDDVASVQQGLETEIDDVTGEVRAIYSLQVQTDANGQLVTGGVVIGATGETVDAIWNVDTFAFTDPNGGAIYPFIYSGGKTIIQEAMIEQLTFSKLVDENGDTVIEDGRIRGDLLQVNEAESAGQTNGRPSWALRPNGTAELQNARVRGDVEASTLKGGVAMVDTLNIKGEAVIVPRSVFFTNTRTISEDGWQQAAQMTLGAGTFTDGTKVMIMFGGFLRLSSQNDITAAGYRVILDGTVIRTFDFGAWPVPYESGSGQHLVDQPAYGFITTMDSSSHSIVIEVDMSDNGVSAPLRRLRNWYITLIGSKDSGIQ